MILLNNLYKMNSLFLKIKYENLDYYARKLIIYLLHEKIYDKRVSLTGPGNIF